MALPATTVWEVRTTGAATNGGGFNSARGGVDLSQSDSGTALTGLATSGAGVTTLTASGTPFASANVGNLIYIASGTNFTAGFYEITTFSSPSSVVLDRTPTPSGAGSDGVGTMGGAQSSLSAVSPAVVAGNTVWIKAGTYTMGSGWTIPANIATANSWISYLGYNASRGDATYPCVLIDSNNFNGACITVGAGTSQNAFTRLQHIEAYYTSGSNGHGINLNCRNTTLYRCRTRRTSADGIRGTGAGHQILNCESYNFARSTANAAGVRLAGGLAHSCVAHNDTNPVASYGYILTAASSAVACAALNPSRGFAFTLSVGVAQALVNCTTYSCASGIYVSGNTGHLLVLNHVSVDDTNAILDGTTAPYGTIVVANSVYSGATGLNATNLTAIYPAGSAADHLKQVSAPLLDPENFDLRVSADAADVIRTGFPGGLIVGLDAAALQAYPATFDLGAVQRPGWTRRN